MFGFFLGLFIFSPDNLYIFTCRLESCQLPSIQLTFGTMYWKNLWLCRGVGRKSIIKPYSLSPWHNEPLLLWKCPFTLVTFTTLNENTDVGVLKNEMVAEFFVQRSWLTTTKTRRRRSRGWKTTEWTSLMAYVFTVLFCTLLGFSAYAGSYLVVCPTVSDHLTVVLTNYCYWLFIWHGYLC